MEQDSFGNALLYWPVALITILVATIVVGCVDILFRKRIKGYRPYFAAGCLPLIGHALNFTEKKIIKFNEDMTRKAKKESGNPDYEALVLGRRYIVISRPDAAMELLRSRPGKFRRERNFEVWAEEFSVLRGMFNVENPHWGRIRRLTSSSFSPAAINDMGQLIFAESQKFITSLNDLLCRPLMTGGVEIDGLLTFKKYTIAVMFRLAFGSACDSIEYVRSGQLSRDIDQLNMYAFRRSVSPLPNWLWSVLHSSERTGILKIAARIKELVSVITSSREKSSSSQFLSSLQSASLNESGARSSLSEEELVAQIITFLIAGTDTTSIAMESFIYMISQQKFLPLQLELQSEVDSLFGGYSNTDTSNPEFAIKSIEQLDALPLLNAVFMESLRLRGPGRFLFLETAGSEDVALSGGYIVRAGVRIHFIIWRFSTAAKIILLSKSLHRRNLLW
jgi:cytochrome P450